MLTPRFLGVILLIAALVTYLWSRQLESKLLLFYSWMFILFGCAACFKIKSNPKMLKHKYILITGCDTGIGNALAHYLCMEEVIVFAGFLNSQSESAEELKRNYPDHCHILQLDVTKDEDVLDSFNLVQTVLGEKDVLLAVVNNAGLNHNGNVEMSTMNQYQRIMDINYLGTVRVTKMFLPLIRKAKGRIINVSSMKGRFAWASCAAYTASKFAVEGFTDCLRREMSCFDVKVILTEPGHFGGATNCLADTDRIHQDFKEMWSASSEPVRTTYGPDFHAALEQMVLSGAESSAKSVQPVVMAIVEALAADNPADRYAVGGTNTKFIDCFKWEAILSGFLPATLVDLYLEWTHNRDYPLPQELGPANDQPTST